MTSTTLFVTDLYNRALIQPAMQGANRLMIVSGYATPAMASRLLTDLNSQVDHPIDIALVIGMTGKEGLSLQDHKGFIELQTVDKNSSIKVSYTTNDRSIHTKLYVWLNDETPVCAFAGSSNFTQNGFLIGWRKQRHGELLVFANPHEAFSEYLRIESESLDSLHPDIDEEVVIRTRQASPVWSVATTDEVSPSIELEGLESVLLPLVALTNNTSTGTVRGEPHKLWGLNWGQRNGREKNQAVIPIPKRVWALNSEFFPRGKPFDRPQFLLTTDDNKSLFMVVAEDGDKALHSVPNNSLVGEYFRHRLGVPFGEPIRLDDLKRGGSRFVKIYRTEDESYYLAYTPEVEIEGSEFYRL